MARTIFNRENNSSEQTLTVQDDGSITHTVEHSGYSIMKTRGANPQITTLTAEEAKSRWPQHAQAIDEALAEVK